MGQSSCGTGHCSTKKDIKGNGCSKTNVYDWLSDIEIPSFDKFDIYEIRFKNGARKGFYKNTDNLDIYVGDQVVVESTFGYDIGKVTLSGELVKLQLKKRKLKVTDDFNKILRIASSQELEIQEKARAKEKETMLRARILTRNLNLDMKLGDVEFQGDGKKATFYYTANHRVDFRQLIKDLAQEFRVKIEMRQIGARQEAALIGGIGACGRELCSTTWMNSLKSVNISAARYQNLSINQTKLSGLCGRLKCCLNFELDTYLDALKGFPKKADYIETEKGSAKLVKTDILKGIMFYTYTDNNTFFPITIEKVKMVLDMNKKGEKPDSLEVLVDFVKSDADTLEFADVVGHISIGSLDKAEKKSKRKGRKSRRRKPNREGNPPTNQTTPKNKTKPESNDKTKASDKPAANKRRRQRRRRPPKSNDDK